MTITTSFTVTLLLVSGVMITSMKNVEASPVSCVKTYQKAFEILMGVKENCDRAALKDCCQIKQGADLFTETINDGVYSISNVCPHGNQPFLSHQHSITFLQARCDMETDEGGWLVIMRRKSDASPLVNFTRTWNEYENGFGDLNTEFWYGLRNMHCLTQRDDLELRIDLQQNDGSGISWTYQQFKVAGPDDNYRLTIGEAEGTGGSNAIAYNNGRQFSTTDRDNDNHSGIECTDHAANGRGGGWWYGRCGNVFLTRPHTGSPNYNWWNKGQWIYYPHVEMKVRPKSCLE